MLSRMLPEKSAASEARSDPAVDGGQRVIHIIVTVDLDRPITRLVEAAEQVHDRGFASASRSDQGDHFSRLDLERKSVRTGLRSS